MTNKRVCSPVRSTSGGGDVIVGNSGELASSVAVEEIPDERYEEDTAEKGSNNDACNGS